MSLTNIIIGLDSKSVYLNHNILEIKSKNNSATLIYLIHF